MPEAPIAPAPRMKNPALINLDAMRALQALGVAAQNHGVPNRTIGLVQLRASQINGCGVCLDMHWREMRQHGETDERLLALAAWRETPYFTAAERAALALTEAATRIADRADAVSDDTWHEAAQHYDEEGLAALVIAIATINAWNRINATTRQLAHSIPASATERRQAAG